MNEVLFYYHKVDPTTWVYLSSLLMIGLFFKFSRFWSVRNLDLLLLILLAPGLLLCSYGYEQRVQAASQARLLPNLSSSGNLSLVAEEESDATKKEMSGDEGSADASKQSPDADEASPAPSSESESDAPSSVLPTEKESDDSFAEDENSVGASDSQQRRQPSQTELAAQKMQAKGVSTEWLGYIWLLSVSGLFLLRLLLDSMMVRRPLLEPNLSPGGLTFLGFSLIVFLMANIITSTPSESDLEGPRRAEQFLSRRAVEGPEDLSEQHGPGYALIFLLPSIPTVSMLDVDENTSPQMESKEQAYATMAKMAAIFSQLAIVIGIVAIGYRHFDNVQMGIGAATLYLMLPYTAQMTGRVYHVLPAAFLVWAILFYRRPFTAGAFLGLATSVIYYPLFLLPLWISFYWRRGRRRFFFGLLTVLAAAALSLIFISASLADYLELLRRMFGVHPPALEGLSGVWGLGWEPIYRLPVLTAFVGLSLALAVWPAQKNLGTLMSCSAALMVGVQFWHGYGGGMFMAWYLPLALLTVFRPNLEDRIATVVLSEGWFPRRRRIRKARSDLGSN